MSFENFFTPKFAKIKYTTVSICHRNSIETTKHNFYIKFNFLVRVNKLFTFLMYSTWELRRISIYIKIILWAFFKFHSIVLLMALNAWLKYFYLCCLFLTPFKMFLLYHPHCQNSDFWICLRGMAKNLRWILELKKTSTSSHRIVETGHMHSFWKCHHFLRHFLDLVFSVFGF